MAYAKKKENPTAKSMATVKRHIKEKAFLRLYVLFGEEKYLVNQFRDMLLKELVPNGDTMNFTRYSQDTFNVNSVINDMVTIPFLAEHRVVLVEDSGYFEKSETDIIDAISQMPEENVVIFCENKVDKVRKPYLSLKKIENAELLEFNALDQDTLIKWLSVILSEGGLKVRATVPDRLIAACGTDMYMLENESKKLHDFCMEKGTITDEDFEKICVNPVEDKIFDMCEAISRKNAARAIELYTDLLTLKTKPMTVITLTERQFSRLAIVSQLLSEKADTSRIAKTIGIPPFAVNKLVQICRGYNQSAILAAVDQCQRASFDVKMGNLLEENAAANLIIKLTT